MSGEGFKETENTRIEKDEENRDEIEMLYSFGVIIFEHVLLESEQYTYSISYFAPQEIYDIVKEDKKKNRLICYKTRKELTGQYKEYFQLNQNDTITVKDEKIRCTSHSIEYTL